MLKMAAKRAGSVRARNLGELTLSVMQGEDGKQKKELDRLLHWLDGVEKPDLVHLSTPLLMGIGLAIRKRFGIPVVCTVHDEDVWIDAMEEPWRTRCWETMAAGGRDVAAFISLSRWYGEVMRERLKIESAKMHVIPVGVDAGDPPSGAPPSPQAVGYLARMAESMGLPILVDAWLRLRKQDRFKSLRLHLSGGKTGDDVPFLDRLWKRFADEGVTGDVTYFDDFSPKGRRAFLSTLSALSVPTPVAFGTYILEAGAAGVPVVEPRVGSYPELIEATGGGVLYEPNTPEALAAALGDLLADESRRADLGRKGRESVARSFSLATMAQRITDLYRTLVPAPKVMA
jgi:glycosyltransferase involved in cell wall biosynthesis